MKPTLTTSPLIEGIIEKLTMAITHSKQGVYAINKEFVRKIILSFLQKVESETIENAKWYEKVYSEDYKKQIEKETVERVLRVLPNKQPNDFKETGEIDYYYIDGFNKGIDQSLSAIKKEFKRE
jgi:hypothetical protein